MKPYQFSDELPHGTLSAANVLDGSADGPPDHDWLPIGAETRWQAATRLLESLELRDDIDIDTVRVLLAIAEQARRLDTDAIERAISREAAIMRSNADPDRRGGRPSKVDSLAQAIGSTCALAEREGFDGAESQTATRDRLIRGKVRDADISRSTFYRLRDRVREARGVDIAEIVSPPEPA